MDVNVHAPFSVSESLEALAIEKAEKLGTYYDRITYIDVYFRQEEDRRKQSNGYTAELKADVPGQILFASEQAESFEKALAGATEKMRKLLVKFKEQLA